MRDTGNTNAMPTRWMSQQQTAEYVGCSIRQLQILTRQGRLPVSYALGPRSPRYDRLAIDAAMQHPQPTENSTSKKLL